MGSKAHRLRQLSDRGKRCGRRLEATKQKLLAIATVNFAEGGAELQEHDKYSLADLLGGPSSVATDGVLSALAKMAEAKRVESRRAANQAWRDFAQG